MVAKHEFTHNNTKIIVKPFETESAGQKYWQSELWIGNARQLNAKGSFEKRLFKTSEEAVDYAHQAAKQILDGHSLNPIPLDKLL
jgi:hypothetical protein